MPVNVSYLYNVTLHIDGVLEASKDHDSWPLKHEKSVMDFIWISDSKYIKLTGKGTVQGHGY